MKRKVLAVSLVLMLACIMVGCAQLSALVSNVSDAITGPSYAEDGIAAYNTAVESYSAIRFAYVNDTIVTEAAMNLAKEFYRDTIAQYDTYRLKLSEFESTGEGDMDAELKTLQAALKKLTDLQDSLGLSK